LWLGGRHFHYAQLASEPKKRINAWETID